VTISSALVSKQDGQQTKSIPQMSVTQVMVCFLKEVGHVGEPQSCRLRSSMTSLCATVVRAWDHSNLQMLGARGGFEAEKIQHIRIQSGDVPEDRKVCL